MKREFKIIGLLLLMITSLFSVGFASWTISYSYQEAEISGSFEADDVIESKDFMTLNLTKTLRYSKGGFLNSDKTKDSLIINGTVDLTKCRTSFDNSTKIQIELNLKYADSINTSYDLSAYPLLNKIDSTNATRILPSDKDISSGLSITKDSSNYKVQIEIILSEYIGVSTFSFELSYNFIIEDSTYFSNTNSPLSKNNTSLFKLTSVVSAM